MPSPVVQDFTIPFCITASRHGIRALPARLVSFYLEIMVIPYMPDNDKSGENARGDLIKRAHLANDGE